MCHHLKIGIQIAKLPLVCHNFWNAPTKGTKMSDFLSRVASAPISWGICEVPDWGAMLPTDRVLGEMQGLGLTATELGAPGFLPWHRAYLLDLEREAFLSLCGERKTLERIQAVLKQGRPIRN
jgi:hypothetical protein